MKKILVFLSLSIAWIYLSSAIDMVLTSWTKLDDSSWNNLSSVLNKTDVSWYNININWKLSVDWKICDLNDNCFWECAQWEVLSWSACVKAGSTAETALEGSTCKTLLENNSKYQNKSWFYYIKPAWFTTVVRAYCDMTTNWWGRTRWYNSSNSTGQIWDSNNCKTAKHYSDSNFECINPLKITNKTEYMLIRWSSKVYPTSSLSRYTWKSSGWYSYAWWSFPSYTCREYARYWKNRWYWSWSHSNLQTSIDCYLR